MSLPKTLGSPIRMTSIVSAFKPSENIAPHNISEYYRGKGNVTDQDENINIPTSGEIKYSDFIGASNEFAQEIYTLPPIGYNANSAEDFYKIADHRVEGFPQGNWSSLPDRFVQYITRTDEAYSVAIDITGPMVAEVKIDAVGNPNRTPTFSLETEKGEPSSFEQILSDSVYTDGILDPGNYEIQIPKKITRFRFVATAGGGSGSIQKFKTNDPQDITNLEDITKVSVEEGYKGGDVTVSALGMDVTIYGAEGGKKLGTAQQFTEVTEEEEVVTQEIVTETNTERGGFIMSTTGVAYEAPGTTTDVINLIISENTLYYDVSTKAFDAGWNGDSLVTLTINTGVWLWSDNSSSAALTIFGQFPKGLIINNFGYIIGKGGNGGQYPKGNGGAGGPAIMLDEITGQAGDKITFNIHTGSFIAGGGGGGGAGKEVGSDHGYSSGGGGAGGGLYGGFSWAENPMPGEAAPEIVVGSNEYRSVIIAAGAGGVGGGSTYNRSARARGQSGGRQLPGVSAVTSSRQYRDSRQMTFMGGGSANSGGATSNELGNGAGGGGWGASGGGTKRGGRGGRGGRAFANKTYLIGDTNIINYGIQNGTIYGENRSTG